MNKRAKIGSRTAKGGFANEKSICKKFNNWQKDSEAQDWLKVMGYDVKKLTSVSALKVPMKIKKSDYKNFNLKEDYERFVRFKKADAQIRIIIKIGDVLCIENLSLKKANVNADFNQVDKRTVDAYKEMWKFDSEITKWLKLFTGETLPSKNLKPKDKRRMFLDAIPERIRNKIISIFKKNKILVVSDVLKGRGGLSADWMLVTRYNSSDNTTSWILKDINEVMNFFGSGDVVISPKGSLKIGRIFMQRKGGTPDPTKLQFKFKPNELFTIDYAN